MIDYILRPYILPFHIPATSRHTSNSTDERIHCNETNILMWICFFHPSMENAQSRVLNWDPVTITFFPPSHFIHFTWYCFYPKLRSMCYALSYLISMKETIVKLIGPSILRPFLLWKYDNIITFVLRKIIIMMRGTKISDNQIYWSQVNIDLSKSVSKFTISKRKIIDEYTHN